MAEIDGVTFGSIVIEGRKYHRHVLMLVDGMVKKRSGGFLMFGSHEIEEREPEELSRGQPEVLIVVTGTDGATHLPTRAQAWARANSVGLLVEPSYDAIVRLNELV